VARFEELDWQSTPRGEISLRRRWDPVTEQDVHEVKLGEEFLMSSQFTVAEEELARLALAAAPVGERPLEVVVGGLGLGYTARTVLADPRVGALHVVDAIAEVIDWHRRGLVPLGAQFTGDARCRLVHGDFFAMVRSGLHDGAGALEPVDVIAVDIDHSPRHVLHPDHADFYTEAGTRTLLDRLRPGGVFALWSDDPPEEEYLTVLRTVFDRAEGHLVTFANPVTGGTSTNGVYVAVAAG
jgi:spermidine synthase